MAKRDLSLTTRPEAVRELTKTLSPVHFTTDEIKQHFTENVKILKDQFQVADKLLTSGNEESCNIIWRSQIVMVEGLLDFYIHEVSKYCMLQMFCGNWEKSEKYASFVVPMSRVEEALAARESSEWFFDYLNFRFSRDVYLSAESMREQLNLIGIGYVSVMVKAFPRGKEELSIKDGTEIVQNLYRRRNEIAHQNDRNHATGKQTPISKETVQKYISNVESIVGAIQSEMEVKDL